MTRLITSIAESDASRMIEAASRALRGGSDLVELRLDALAVIQGDFANRAAAVLPESRWLATLRSRSEGGQSTNTENNATAVLSKMVARGALVDIEARTLDAIESRDRSAITGKSAVVSRHYFDGRPRDVRNAIELIEAAAPTAVAKLAWMTSDVRDNLSALGLQRDAPDRRIVICMGEKGLLSRVLAGKCQAFGTFCAPDEGPPAAEGQVCMSDMIDLYRVKQQTPATQVYGVIGSPVAHSLGPLIFNRQFRDDGLDAVYVPVRIDDETELTGFLDACRRTDWLSIRGFSVTLPHKHAVLRWADTADETTRRIGAANTLDLSGASAVAINTDCSAAISVITASMNDDGRALGGMQAMVLGAGGVARAIVAGLCDRGANVIITNRTAGRAKRLAGEFGCKTAPWNQRHRTGAKLLVNCTSVGMSPNTSASPMPDDGLSSEMIVFDTIYNPAETELVRMARQIGCRTIGGAKMFVEQAAMQYRIWTGRVMDTQQAARRMTAALSNGKQPS